MKCVSIKPADLLDGAKTIRLDHKSICDWLPTWIAATTFLEWSKRGLSEGGGYGLCNALSYAKVAVASRIDRLLQSNYLVPFSRRNYPEKIEALQQIGITIPGVVWPV
jgi:hypothetical protein